MPNGLQERGRVAIISDDPVRTRSIVGLLLHEFYSVVISSNAEVYINFCQSGIDFDSVLVVMESLNGVSWIVDQVRQADQDVPVLVITPEPDMSVKTNYPVNFHFGVSTIREKIVRRVTQHRLFKRHITDLEEAMKMVYVHYQPIIRWSTRSVYAYEALARTKSNKYAHIGQMFDVAGIVGRTAELGAAIRAIAPEPLPNMGEEARLFVNINAEEIDCEDLRNPDNALAKAANMVTLEIIETDGHVHNDGLAALREVGYKVALDDLGAGHSSLNRLVDMSPDIVKLDIKLATGIETDVSRQKLIELVVGFCDSMGREVIAEGVETVEQLKILLSLGIDLYQGFLFAKPGPAFVEPEWPVIE